MFDQLINNLKKQVPFTNEETSAFSLYFERRHYNKNSFIIEHGQICNMLYYINYGIVRCYTPSTKKEITHNFWKEDSWFSDYESLMLQKPSELYFETLDDTELFVLPYDSLDKIFTKGQNFEKWGRVMGERRLIDFLLKEKPEKLTTNIDDRYIKFVNENPDLINRVPLKYVASYLGVQPETLSRIRKRLATNYR